MKADANLPRAMALGKRLLQATVHAAQLVCSALLLRRR